MRRNQGWWICLFITMFLTPATLIAETIVADGVTGELKENLLTAYRELRDDYAPRTEHFDEAGEPRYLNRLISEASPYLLQHAHNPVNWYPWGSEAFDAAREFDKPVFLSIGYATCHWCHVMERESFENEEIAEFLNEHFIAIKVDREQRPDVDSTYMTAVQMLTGSGGWPLSSFLNPGSQPFHGGTYYPPGVFKDMLKRVVEVWGESREELDASAEQISQALATATSLSEKVRDIGDHDVSAALSQLMASHDSKQGGFGQAPKFPREASLLFLLDQARRTSDKSVLDAVNFTLQRIAAGGIHDQVGGGFHRYATDANWLIPHFEKMLYNQAGLALAYTEAWLLTADVEHQRTARRALDYVLREMTSPQGLFYSATDADSGDGEGEFFIWTLDELDEFLSESDAAIARTAWNMTERGNFENRNILHHKESLKTIAGDLDMTSAELVEKLDAISVVLLDKRQERPAPLRDEKMITGWNGMMINAFARAGDVFDDAAYLSAAKRAADALLASNVREVNGGKRLWRAMFNDNWSVNAGQADYAYLAEGLVTLYDVTGEQRYLQEAESLVEAMNSDFWDEDGGGYFMGSQVVGGAALPTRPKDIYDNAFHSGNAAAARTLARLWNRTGSERYYEKAMSLFGAFSESISRGPSNFPYLLTALAELQNAEIGQRQYAARGKVRLHGKIKDGRIDIDVAIADGWHINANKPLQDYLIGTSLMDAANTPITGTEYPEAERTVLGFQRAELALYHDTFSISAPVPTPVVAGVGNLLPVSLELQACNDEVCLAPETVTMTLAM